MSNDTTGNPWILDTADTIVSSGTRVRILKMMYYAGAADDDLHLQDGSGKSIWRVRAASAAANYEDYAGVPFDVPETYVVDGFIINTIDGGALWVWLK